MKQQNFYELKKSVISMVAEEIDRILDGNKTLINDLVTDSLYKKIRSNIEIGATSSEEMDMLIYSACWLGLLRAD